MFFICIEFDMLKMCGMECFKKNGVKNGWGVLYA